MDDEKRTGLSLEMIFIMVFSLLVILICAFFLVRDINRSNADAQRTVKAEDLMVDDQPTPTDFEYSLEIWNLIRRSYWVNGQREKALSYPCPISDAPPVYVVLLTDGGAVLGAFTADGKISYLSNSLKPNESLVSTYALCSVRGHSTDENGYCRERICYKINYVVVETPDVDGSYGPSNSGIFFFTPDGDYIEWNGAYLYSSIPFEVKDPVLQF